MKHLLTGTKSSERLFLAYEKLEKRFEFFIDFGIKFAVLTLVAMFGAPAFIPVAYIIFGVPEPEHWDPVFGYK